MDRAFEWRRLVALLRFAVGTFRKRPDQIKYIIPFLRSHHDFPGGKAWDSITLSKPWVSFTLHDYLRKTIKPDMVIFEWGSGGSTLFFADRVAKLHSVEHDKCWFQRISDALDSAGIQGAHLQHVSPEPGSGNGSAISTRSEYRQVNFEKYVRAIEAVPDRSLDLVLVDGRSRVACMLAARRKVKWEGRIILDDSAREHYSGGIDTMIREGWHANSLEGLKPGTLAWGTATIFTRSAAKQTH